MRRVTHPDDRGDPYPWQDDGTYPPDPDTEVDAADYARKPDWGEAKAVVIYSAKRKPRWYQWRQKRKWFEPILLDLNVDDGSVEGGTFTVGGALTITLEG